MLVISTRELTQNQNKFFELAHTQRVIVKRKNRFFQLIDLGNTIPELTDLDAKIEHGIQEYRAGETKTLKADDINAFLGL